MSPVASRALTGAATLAVVAPVAYTAVIGDAATFLACLACGFAVGVAWVIVRHDATSPVGPALAWTGAFIALVSSTSGPLSRLPWATGQWPLNLAGLLALLLVFPSGPSTGRLWRAVPWAFGAATVGMVAAQWGASQQDGEVVGGPSGQWVSLVALMSILTIGVCMLLATASLVIRYQRGEGRTRRQVRWLIFAGFAVVVLLVAGWVAEALGASIEVSYTPFLAAIVIAVPAAVGIAIVRHDLFDIDRLISEAAAWAITVVLSVGLYGAVVLASSQVVHRYTDVGAALAAFMAALALLPVYRALTKVVGQVVDRDRWISRGLVEQFAADVRAGRREPEDVETVLREAQGDSSLRLLLASPEHGWVSVAGAPTAETDGFALEAGGDEIARIVLGWDSARARRRIAELAQAAWVPIEVSRLRLVLRDALEEATASRARLAEAAAEERKRLERDLHDGAQQRLIATGMRLRLLQRELPTVQAQEVRAAVSELQDTVDELRRLANGIRPSRLDDGLAAALSAVREVTPLPFELSVDDLPPVDETRALTAYHVVSEAVANTLKHAHASRIEVCLTGVGDRLRVQVSDDGVGGLESDAPLTALRDRVLSVGGTLTVASPHGTGTTIEAVL